MKKKIKLKDLEVTSFRTEHIYIRAGAALAGKEPEYTEEGYPDCGKTGLLVDPNCQH
jgi:hypothetical protein